MAEHAGGSVLLRRYAPFLVLVVAQAVLVGLVPSVRHRGAQNVLASGATGGGATVGGPMIGSPQDQPGAASAGPGTTAATASTATGAGSAAARQAGAAVGRGATAPGAATSTNAAADRSHCTPDGRQQGITSWSPPCVPKFVGDNGGATYAGVTRDKIVAVLVRNSYGPVVDSALKSVGLAASPQDEESTMYDFGKFFNKRYELYGRQVEWHYYYTSCDMSTSVDCARSEARTIIGKFHPFTVVTPLAVLPEYFDELSHGGVVNLGGWHFTAKFMQRERPYHYDWMPDGTRVAHNLADYWCKKMAGKNATLAGDATMHAMPRKLGITVASNEDPVAQSNELLSFIQQECGGVGEAPKVYQYSGDMSKSQTEFAAIITAMRNDKVTTVLCLCDPIRPAFLTTAADQQQYFPEHLISGMGASDHDYFGRLYAQDQWKNAFGPGIQPAPQPLEQQDDYKAYQDVGAQYRCYACLANFIWMHLAAVQIEYAGPALNPANVEAGTLSSPPIGGYERTHNPLVQLIQFGPGQYTAVNDSMHVYWDPNAPSPIDGKAGHYVCVDDGCRRFEIGKWNRGEPKQKG